MKRPLAVIVALASFGLILYSLSSFDSGVVVPNFSIPRILHSPLSPLPVSDSSSLTLNAPLLSFQSQDGGEISLAEKTEVVSFFFGGTPAEFAAVGLDTTDMDLVQEIKAAGNDTNLDISVDRHHATLKNGQTVYYGVKILPAAREKVTGVTFVLTTVPISGIPDIVNNYFKIRYVEAVGGRAGDVKNDSTSGKAYQVITPAGEHLYYFSFTAVVCKGGIRTKIEPHFFGGATVRDVLQDYLQCCCVHTKKPLPRVPEITTCWWYGFPYIGDWFTYWFKVCLAQTAAANTASVPCNDPEATGKDLTITGSGFSRLAPLTPDRIKITDECGTVARVTEIVSQTDTEIKARIDITACRPGIKTVKIEGAGGFATTTLLKVVQDVPDTIVGQKRFQAVRVLGTQEKLPLTFTINNGENITFAADQSFNVTCVSRSGATTATTTTTGGCNNIVTTTVQGTALSGEDTMIVTGNGIRCEAPIRNADITLVAVPEGKSALVCVGELQEVKVTVKSPSTYYSAVILTSSSAPDAIRVWADQTKTTQVLLGTPIFANPVPTPAGSMNAERTFWVEGLKAGTVCLTAIYCDKTGAKCDTVALTVMELLTLTATSSTGKNVTDDDNDSTKPAPILYLCEDANGNGSLTLTATTNPSSTQGVYYQIEESTATPATGAIPSGNITLSTSSGNRRFLIHAGLDCNGDGKLNHPVETTRTIDATVGKMTSLTVIDKADVTHQATDMTDGGDNPVLTFSGVPSADVSLLISVLPVDGSILSQARYQVTASNGLLIEDKKVDSENPFIHLMPLNGITSFTITAGLDCNGNEKLDQEERQRSIDILFIMSPLRASALFEIEDPILGDGQRALSQDPQIRQHEIRHEEKGQYLKSVWEGYRADGMSDEEWQANKHLFYYPLPSEVYSNGSGDYLLGMHIYAKYDITGGSKQDIKQAKDAVRIAMEKFFDGVTSIKMDVFAEFPVPGKTETKKLEYTVPQHILFDGSQKLTNANNQWKAPLLAIPHGLGVVKVGKNVIPIIDISPWNKTARTGAIYENEEVEEGRTYAKAHIKLLLRFKKFALNAPNKDLTQEDIDQSQLLFIRVELLAGEQVTMTQFSAPVMYYGPKTEIVEMGVVKEQEKSTSTLEIALGKRETEQFMNDKPARAYVNATISEDADSNPIYVDIPNHKHLREFPKPNEMLLSVFAKAPAVGVPIALTSLVDETEGIQFHLAPRKTVTFQNLASVTTGVNTIESKEGVLYPNSTTIHDHGYYDTTALYKGTQMHFHIGVQENERQNVYITYWAETESSWFWNLVIWLGEWATGKIPAKGLDDLFDKIAEELTKNIADETIKKEWKKLWDAIRDGFKKEFEKDIDKQKEFMAADIEKYSTEFIVKMLDEAADRGDVETLYRVLQGAYVILIVKKEQQTGAMHRVALEVSAVDDPFYRDVVPLFRKSSETELKEKDKYYPNADYAIGAEKNLLFMPRYGDYRISFAEQIYAFSLMKQDVTPVGVWTRMRIVNLKNSEGHSINGRFQLKSMLPVPAE